MTKTFWTFEHDGKRMDLECETRRDAVEYINEWFAEKCQEGDRALRNGESFVDEGVLIEYQVDDNGVVTYVRLEKYPLEYEHYHGDYAEHNTHWGL